MEASCQRCHETLRDGDRYCHVCGLPQLIYLVAETAEPGTGDGTVAIGGVSREMFGVGSGIAWRPALRMAIMLGIPAGFIGLSMKPLGLIGVSVVGAWAAVMYARRTRTTHLPASVGARIGMVMGLIAGWFACGMIGATLWLSRFVLHQGDQFDSLRAAAIEEQLAANQRFAVQMGAASTHAAQNAEMVRNWMSSTEGRAEFVIVGFAVMVAVLVALGSIGGAAGARFLAQPRRPSA